MPQHFSSSDHKKFKKLFGIQDTPTKWDIEYTKKLNKYIPYISWIPGLQMIGIWNSLSMNCWKKSSDIDLYIVTSENRMWIVRILITMMFQILRVRKTGSKHAGRFCLSFFSTLKWMDFSKFSLERDPYLFFWTLYFKPILSNNKSYEKFITLNSHHFNLWDFSEIIENNKAYISYSKSTKESNSKLWDILESILKKIFLPKTKKSFQKLWEPFGVIISDTLLKFHDNDIRKNISHKI